MSQKRRIKMEQLRVEREIKRVGEEYTFYRTVKNEFGEDTEQKEEVCKIRGIFHVTKGYITKQISESSVIVSKGQPLILVIKDMETDKIKQGDFIEINGVKYIVNETNNVNEFDILYEISLEVVLNGNSEN